MHNWPMMSINPCGKSMDMKGLCHEFLNDKDEHGKHHCSFPNTSRGFHTKNIFEFVHVNLGGLMLIDFLYVMMVLL